MSFYLTNRPLEPIQVQLMSGIFTDNIAVNFARVNAPLQTGWDGTGQNLGRVFNSRLPNTLAYFDKELTTAVIIFCDT